jgi:ABC-type antimicrobial peptide transport system permease subunit
MIWFPITVIVYGIIIVLVALVIYALILAIKALKKYLKE